MHFLHSGEKHASLARFFAAVEDHYEQAVGFAYTQTPCFLLTHPWNQRKAKMTGLTWVQEWSVLTDILIRYGKCLQR